jgi:O-acetyl-ADP-ribose deacetylase (regulator of RNase III)
MAVSSRFPQAKSQYKRAIRKGAGLGDVVFTDGTPPDDDAIVVANMIAQKGIDGSGRKVMYGALRKCLKKVAEFAASRPGVTIHMPLIGCGLGGGRWEEVEPIVKECLGEFEVYVYGRPMCGWGC